MKEEKPRSSVIPLSRDCGFLSKAAVDAVLLNALASDVFPLSTCPSTPMLKFNVFVRLSEDSDILLNSHLPCVYLFTLRETLNSAPGTENAAGCWLQTSPPRLRLFIKAAIPQATIYILLYGLLNALVTDLTQLSWKVLKVFAGVRVTLSSEQHVEAEQFFISRKTSQGGK